MSVYTERAQAHEAAAYELLARGRTRDQFGDLPSEWCHRGECCGPGSWCCLRAGLHYHDDVDPPQWVGQP